MKNRISLFCMAIAMLILVSASDLAAQEVSKADGTPVLVSIKDGNIVALKLFRDSGDQKLAHNTFLARATSRANRLRIEFLTPLNRERNASLKAGSAQVGFDEETSQAFGAACGVAEGAYKVSNADSKNPFVEVVMVQRASHRPRRSRNRDECNPFGR